jgi:CBS domain-containing protein
MQIREIMSHPVQLIDPNTTVRDVACKMRADDVGALPIGENDRLIGMVTDRDIVVRAVAEDKRAGNVTAREVMSEGIFWCFEDEDVERAAELMAEHQVRRLPVVNRDKRLVGMVALADLGRSGNESTAETLSAITEPTGQPRRVAAAAESGS